MPIVLAFLVIPTTFGARGVTTIVTYQGSTTTITMTQVNDPIKTGNPLYDQFDSLILSDAQSYGLDALLLKAQVAQESYFNPQAVSQDDPCGVVYQNGMDVGHSYGLMQLTPSCVSWFARNPDGTINLTLAENPTYNLASGAKDMQSVLSQMKYVFPSCTSQEYSLMALGAYNSGNGAIYSCSAYSVRAQTYIDAVLTWYHQFGGMSY